MTSLYILCQLLLTFLYTLSTASDILITDRVCVDRNVATTGWT